MPVTNPKPDRPPPGRSFDEQLAWMMREWPDRVRAWLWARFDEGRVPPGITEAPER